MKVKICGITHLDDVKVAVEEGADFIGIIFSPQSKRVVTISQAKEICDVIRGSNTQPVAVFVDESAAEIKYICNETDISIIQLHGKKSQDHLFELQHDYKIFYAMLKGSKEPSSIKNIIPLYDNEKNEVNNTFNRDTFKPPVMPWILAGGLTIKNVFDSIRKLKPYAVDVARGVEYIDRIRKDPMLIKKFITEAKREQNL